MDAQSVHYPHGGRVAHLRLRRARVRGLVEERLPAEEVRMIIFFLFRGYFFWNLSGRSVPERADTDWGGEENALIICWEIIRGTRSCIEDAGEQAS